MGETKLIVIEGLDGTGKTTQAKRLAEALGVDYIKGGGWTADSKLAERTKREGSRDRYFSLMQLSLLREIRKRLKEEREGITGVVDRLVLVDVAHHLSLTWDGKGFPEEKKLWARQALLKYIPEGILGIVLDVDDKSILEKRISRKEVSDVTESDTLNRFEAKRTAWLVCAEMLSWEVVSAEGPENEVYGRIVEFLEKKGILPEGQAARKEVK